jgi:hypothetical protein
MRTQTVTAGRVFLPDGSRNLTASSDKTARVWWTWRGVPELCAVLTQSRGSLRLERTSALGDRADHIWDVFIRLFGEVHDRANA